MAENYRIKLQLRDGRIFTQTNQSDIPQLHNADRYLFIYNVKAGNPTREVNFASNGSGIVNGRTYADIKNGKTTFTIVARNRYERGVIINDVINETTAVYLTNGDNENILWRCDAHPVNVSFEENNHINAIEINVTLETEGVWASNVYATTNNELNVSPSQTYTFRPWGSSLNNVRFTETPLQKANDNSNILTNDPHYSDALLFNKNGLLLQGETSVNVGGGLAMRTRQPGTWVITEDGNVYTVDILYHNDTPVNNILSSTINLGDIGYADRYIYDLLHSLKNGDMTNITAPSGVFVKLAESAMI